MSGIVSLASFDDVKFNPDLLQRMTELMDYRGPDAQAIWSNSFLGFGHTLLNTSSEQSEQTQIFQLDGQFRGMADARLDDRLTLVAKLCHKNQLCSVHASDTELILRAYAVWGSACLQHLIGDFAFIIWDQPQHRLFCARDQFGIKPFYYADLEDCLILGNTLNCIRSHPSISNRLNDLAIADFLLFGSNYDINTTVFADICRLPPAHFLTCFIDPVNAQLEKPRLSRYWELPLDGHIRYRQPMDYVEHFRELIKLAIRDRISTDRISISMSGGLDSSTIAAFAKEILLEERSNCQLQAYTLVYDRLMVDEERYYAGLVASHLNIPIYYTPVDGYTLFEEWENADLQRPEPIMNPLLVISVVHLRKIATQSRVLLVGEGGDPVLYPSNSYFFDQLQALKLGHLVQGLFQYALLAKRLPFIGLRTQLRKWFKRTQPWQPDLPDWLNPAFENRLNLKERLYDANRTPSSSHPTRSLAYYILTQPTWASFFENYDPGVTHFPLEVRYPFFDLRLLTYLLSIPPIPWFVHKELVRVAVSGLLPEKVRRRPKVHLASDPIAVAFKQVKISNLDISLVLSALTPYIIWDKVPLVANLEKNSYSSPVDIYPLCFAKWFMNSRLNSSTL